jgi:hypothetical protein
LAKPGLRSVLIAWLRVDAPSGPLQAGRSCHSRPMVSRRTKLLEVGGRRIRDEVLSERRVYEGVTDGARTRDLLSRATIRRHPLQCVLMRPDIRLFDGVIGDFGKHAYPLRPSLY